MSFFNLVHKCRLKNLSSCSRCREENGEFYCGLSPSLLESKKAGYLIKNELIKETTDSLRQYHNSWCRHYYTELADFENHSILN